MKCKLLIGIVLLGSVLTEATAQSVKIGKDTASIVQLRAQSGIDPITIKSRVLFSSFINDPKGPSGSVTNTAGAMVGIKKWYLGIFGSAVTVLSGNPGEGFSSGIGDFSLSVQNRIYMNKKHGFAVTGAIGYPTGKKGFGSQYFTFTSAFTYLYAFKPSLIMVITPQYTMHVLKDPAYPPLSLLSARVILAKFLKSGSVFGLEAKPLINLQSDVFYLFLSPLFSKSLGAGFNMLLLVDVPINGNASDKGPTYQIGLNRYF